jgi:hypothetical protein
MSVHAPSHFLLHIFLLSLQLGLVSNVYMAVVHITTASVVRVLDYRSEGPGSIPGTTRVSGGGGVERKTSSGSGMGSTQPREYN